ncbi:Uric acid degradation bifunctional protein TTL [Sesamum angolense]|uniref:hydroxyisourate hydrolase n=1 Tax=Sesamum angolense TaxID=2727404 RepID=A0AAE2BTL2_9LAMI|nr:Uric acid degradation bifunctional protein TTL [Sesamum angolense]
MESPMMLGEKEWLACCGSLKFAQEMVSAGPFSNYQEALDAAKDIWFNKVSFFLPNSLDICGCEWMVGSVCCASSDWWSKGEQSTALATATDSTLEAKVWVCLSDICIWKKYPEILAEIKRRYHKRPIVEFELAAKEQMKITELRLAKLFSANATSGSTIKTPQTTDVVTKAGEDRVSIIGGHLTAANETPTSKPSATFTRTRPPITTHILDVARGFPAAGIEVRLETWDNGQSRPLFGQADSGPWSLLGSSTTDKDGRSGQLMNMADALNPGVYRISFNTGKYNPEGFFPFVSIVFEVRESQKFEHFHVPLLLSPFSLSTYRGS